MTLTRCVRQSEETVNIDSHRSDDWVIGLASSLRIGIVSGIVGISGGEHRNGQHGFRREKRLSD